MKRKLGASIFAIVMSVLLFFGGVVWAPPALDEHLQSQLALATDQAGSSASCDSCSKTLGTRIIDFAGRDWIVKSGYGGPGPNYWSDSEQSVWVDGNGWLHLKIRKVGGTWYCSEVYTEQPTQYGMHRFYLISWLDRLDKNVVAAPFLYKDDENEIDIEFSEWGNGSSWFNAQYVVQPWNNPGNVERFSMELNGTHTTHYINWHSSWIRFKSIHGHYEEPPDPGYVIHQWLYTGNDIPPQEKNLRIHINLWLCQGNPPSDGKEVEVILADADLPHPKICEGTDTSCGIYPNCENCNAKDGCYVYGNGCEERNYYCKSNSEGCKYTYSNRHTDDWYPKGNPYPCCDGNNECTCQDQEYRNYYCSGTSCTYAVTSTTTQKTSCSPCNDGNPCTQDSCSDGECVFTPYCSGTDTDCGCTSCENCNAKDGWEDKGNPYPCCDGNNKCSCQDQEYRNYYCSGTSCTYAVTSTTTQKTSCSPCNDGNPCTQDSCSDGECIFTPITYALTVDVEGTGDTAPSPGTHTYDCCTNVNITAIETDPDWEFSHWSGHASGASPTVTIHMDSDKDATAHFSGAGVVVSIDAPDEVAHCTNFTAGVNVTEVTRFAGHQFDVSYNASVLEVTDVTDGLINSTAVDVDWGFVPPATPGTIRVMGVVPDDFIELGINGTGYLAEIHFHAVGSACNTSNITFSNASLMNNLGGKITPVTWVDDSVHIAVCILGDANGDGIVDVGDVIKIRRIILTLDPPTPCADVNGDGFIDVGDVIKTKRIILGID